MTQNKLWLAASLVVTLAACSKSAGEPSDNNAAGSATSGVENSSGSYPPGNSTTGIETSGVGTTGVNPDAVGVPPTPDTVTNTPASSTMEPTAPAQ